MIVSRMTNDAYSLHGAYSVIERPHRLVMTWNFDDDPANQQLIELSFLESDGKAAS
jgi:uncharacterized protein YndB with AHSA1/START domain